MTCSKRWARIGGHHTDEDEQPKQSEGRKATHEEHTCQGISIAQRTWRIGSDAKRSECVCPVRNEGQVKEGIKGARQSQKQSDSNAITHAANYKVGSETSRFECAEYEVQAWKQIHQINTKWSPVDCYWMRCNMKWWSASPIKYA